MWFARDHHRCRVPGCRSTRFLDVHHVVFRKYGGGHAASNLCVLCSGHHDAVHHQRLVITGDAHGGLEFRHPDGRPWGTPPPTLPRSPPPTPTWAEDLAGLARRALRDAGFKAHEASAAVERAIASVGGEVGLPELLRAAFQACPLPRAP